MKIGVFYKKVHKMSAILFELFRYKQDIIEPKTTQHLKDNR